MYAQNLVHTNQSNVSHKSREMCDQRSYVQYFWRKFILQNFKKLTFLSTASEKGTYNQLKSIVPFHTGPVSKQLILDMKLSTYDSYIRDDAACQNMP
jgi:hypothetical protein